MNSESALLQQPQQPQGTPVPQDMELVWTITVRDVGIILQGLGELQAKVSGRVIQHLQETAAGQIMKQMNTPQTTAAQPAPPTIEGPSAEEQFEAAHAALNVAALNRREPNGSLNVMPTGDAENDYSGSLGLVASALQHLDEALPNGQIMRVRAANTALRTGVALFEKWLAPRIEDHDAQIRGMANGAATGAYVNQ